MRFAYADPPYPGLARRYYGGESTYAGEVDHAKLVASLSSESYDGWALSTSSKALRDVLALCPEEARVCPWVKPIGAAPATYGPHNTWEPLIVVGGRKLRPGFRDWLCAQPARGGGSLPGRKPIAFCAFLFQQLGMLPGDSLDDLFPGTGVVGRAWAAMSLRDPQGDGAAVTSRRERRRAGEAMSVASYRALFEALATAQKAAWLDGRDPSEATPEPELWIPYAWSEWDEWDDDGFCDRCGRSVFVCVCGTAAYELDDPICDCGQPAYACRCEWETEPRGGALGLLQLGPPCCPLCDGDGTYEARRAGRREVIGVCARCRGTGEREG